MIDVYTLTDSYYDPDVAVTLPLNTAVLIKGNKYKLDNHTFHYNVGKYTFCPRIVNI